MRYPHRNNTNVLDLCASDCRLGNLVRGIVVEVEDGLRCLDLNGVLKLRDTG